MSSVVDIQDMNLGRIRTNEIRFSKFILRQYTLYRQ